MSIKSAIKIAVFASVLCIALAIVIVTKGTGRAPAVGTAAGGDAEVIANGSW